MNGKQARRLRNIVASEAPGLPSRVYQDKQHPQRLRQAGMNTDGTPKMEVFSPVTRELDEGCQRHVYQKLKALHHTFYGR